MQKRVLAGLPLLTAALIFLGLWIANKLTTPPWKSELNQYIAFKVSPSDPPITIQRTIQASKPWQFGAAMSGETYGDCFYFQVDYCYNVDEAPPSPPLLFPPDEVWCALFKTYTGDEETGWVVYIAKHQDLYNADWIVHESSSSLADPKMMADLAKIGCSRLMEPDR